MAVLFGKKTKTENLLLALPFKEPEQVYGILAKTVKVTNQILVQA